MRDRTTSGEVCASGNMGSGLSRPFVAVGAASGVDLRSDRVVVLRLCSVCRLERQASLLSHVLGKPSRCRVKPHATPTKHHNARRDPPANAVRERMVRREVSELDAFATQK